MCLHYLSKVVPRSSEKFLTKQYFYGPLQISRLSKILQAPKDFVAECPLEKSENNEKVSETASTCGAIKNADIDNSSDGETYEGKSRKPKEKKLKLSKKHGKNETTIVRQKTKESKKLRVERNYWVEYWDDTSDQWISEFVCIVKKHCWVQKPSKGLDLLTFVG